MSIQETKNEFPKIITMYAHGSKERNWELAEEIGLSENAIDMFKYALYEVAFKVKVFEDGSYNILAVKDGEQVLQALGG